MQNSDNFRLNEAAPFVEEENLEEVGEEADQLENYKFAWCCMVFHVWSEQEEAGEEAAELEIDEEVRELMAVWEVYASWWIEDRRVRPAKIIVAPMWWSSPIEITSFNFVLNFVFTAKQ